jgi:tetratricopeptide (TPR) repeat protein
MGVVYEARHEALGRRVAIKVLPAHLFADEKLRARFRRESQAAARLHHTNIVPVFAVGEQDGLCYYVMQLIDGRSLSSEIADCGLRIADSTTDAAGGRSDNQAPGVLPGNPQSAIRNPQSREVARVGAQVADALAYAHSQGVLHRDVKPSNLLLDGRGAVWVTDFGVAKLVEEANLTQSGDLVGTLRYMPPERFLGQSDARGDVYSLGLTLYELLAGRPAFPDTNAHHLIRLITQAEMPPLRKLGVAVPADLETVVQKAVARDPAHRYQTAAELADDLRRFLDDRPVRARRVGAAGQLWRWCRRNRVVAGLSAAALGLLVLTAAVSVTAYFRTASANREAANANDEMRRALGAEQAQREHAEKMSASALAALNRIYDRFAPSRHVVTPGLPADAAAEEEAAPPPQPGLSPEAVRLLEELLGFYEQLAREGGDYPALRAQAAEANHRIGDIRQRLGQFEPAIAAYRKAIELDAQRPTGGRDEAERIKLARTYNELGRALRALQRADEARDAHAQALAALSEAPAGVSGRPECRYELARTYYFQSQRNALAGPPGPDRPRGGGRRGGEGRGRGGGERPPTQRAVAILKVLVKEYPSVPEYRHLLACSYRDGPPDRPPPGAPPGVTGTQLAVETLRQLVKDFPKVPDYRYDLCETLARSAFFGRAVPPAALPAARRQLEEAATLARGLVREYPNVPLYAQSNALVQERLGALLGQSGDRGGAETALRRAVALQSALVRRYPEVAAYDLTLARAKASLARTLAEGGKWQEARALLEEATGRAGALLAKDQRLSSARPFLGRGLRDLAEVLTRLGEHDEAARARRRADDFGPERGRGPGGPRERRGGRGGP